MEKGLEKLRILSDVLRPETVEMVSNLSDMNTDTVLLTGDNKKTAADFAARAGITKVRADLLPEEKVQSISEIQEQGNRVHNAGSCFVVLITALLYDRKFE